MLSLDVGLHEWDMIASAKRQHRGSIHPDSIVGPGRHCQNKLVGCEHYPVTSICFVAYRPAVCYTFSCIGQDRLWCVIRASQPEAYRRGESTGCCV